MTSKTRKRHSKPTPEQHARAARNALAGRLHLTIPPDRILMQSYAGIHADALEVTRANPHEEATRIADQILRGGVPVLEKAWVDLRAYMRMELASVTDPFLDQCVVDLHHSLAKFHSDHKMYGQEITPVFRALEAERWIPERAGAA